MPLKFIQAGVIRCNAPPSHEPGFVPLNILYQGEPISDQIDSCQFEYREQIPKKKRRRDKESFRARSDPHTLLDGDNR